MLSSLNRFLKAQQTDYLTALSEIKSGKKISHWMWFIFPQIAGLGFSETSKYYAIKNSEEAAEFLKHPVLGMHLREISNELIKLNVDNANKVFGSPDDLKLQSCMTLFSIVEDQPGSVFEKVLSKFFNGIPDSRTIDLLIG